MSVKSLRERKKKIYQHHTLTSKAKSSSIPVEERCEPSLPWQRNRKSNRFCPDINEWHELDNYEIGDGGGFDLDTLGKLIPQNISVEKIIGGVIGGLITAGVGGKRSVDENDK